MELTPTACDGIRECLESLLASPEFASSERSRRLLKYVVERTLAQEDLLLKESSIAREVFQRPQYDPAEDSFVRVKAAEVRRRLGEYNRRNAAAAWRIELPTGRYHAQFVHNENPVLEEPAAVAPAPPEPDDARPKWPRINSRLTISALLVVALAACLVLLFVDNQKACLEQVWRPALRGDKQLLIFVPTPTSFVLGPEANARWRSGELVVTPRGTLNNSISQSDLVYYPDKVGLGAAAAAVRLSLLCGRLGRSSHLRFGRDLALVDLRNQPAVILGAFSSPWAEELNNVYRFRLRAGANGSPDAVVDTQGSGPVWVPEQRQDGWPIVDYAIAARILHPVTGDYVFVAAGISTFGTQAAAEFLTDEQDLRMLDRLAPRGWEEQNFQVVLKVKVIGNSPGSPTIVGWKVW